MLHVDKGYSSKRRWDQESQYQGNSELEERAKGRRLTLPVLASIVREALAGRRTRSFPLVQEKGETQTEPLWV